MEHVVHCNIFALVNKLTFLAEEARVKTYKDIKQEDCVDDQINNDVSWVFCEISIYSELQRNCNSVYNSKDEHTIVPKSHTVVIFFENFASYLFIVFVFLISLVLFLFLLSFLLV